MADNHETSSKKIIRKKPTIVVSEEQMAAGGAGAKIDDISIISESLDSLTISDSESTIETKSDTDAPKIKNKGTGAGGANTNLYGKSFEEKTANKTRLIKSGFEEFKIPGHKGKNDIYLKKDTSDGSIIYLSQGGLKSYFKWKFSVELFRAPDEAYLIQKGETYILKILEKKNQNVEGSVDTKLLAGPSFIREYTLCLPDTFKVQYAFCVSTFLENQINNGSSRSKFLKQILDESSIPIFFGDQLDYFEKLDEWINS
jgi:hypothetical protein